MAFESPRILLTDLGDSPSQGIVGYRKEGGYEALASVLEMGDPAALIRTLEAAELRGRGGAAFPVARKWKIAAESTSPKKFVVANGGEHEPGSEKDQFLVASYPHKVLEGMVLCGYGTGAQVGYLYLIADMRGPISAASAAIAEMQDQGVLGDDILGSGFNFEIRIHEAPSTYVAGEETAAIDSIEGGPGKPREKPPYPGNAGIHGHPTTVNNVETLAHVPTIMRNGSEWYRRIGTDGSHGTMLFTLGAQVKSPGVYEMPFGSTFRDVIYGCGGGPASGRAIRAILPALSCGFLEAKHLDTPIDHDALRALGSSPGCGGISFIEEGEDVLARVQEIAQFFVDEQCGQCPPCRMETNQLLHITRGIAAGKGPGFAEQVEKVTNFARGKGLCSLIEMAAAPVSSAIRVFYDDFAEAAGTGNSN